MPNFYIAEVIDNDDQNSTLDKTKVGAVQIYIPELHVGFEPDLYPWAYQFNDWTSNIPEIGDKVWVFFLHENMFKKPYYLSKLNLIEYHNHGETIGQVTEVYPNVKYMQLSDGTAIALGNTGEISVYSSTGSEFYLDKNGLFHIKDKNGNKIDSTTTSIKINSTNLEVLK
jgi:hypothetical protein